MSGFGRRPARTRRGRLPGHVALPGLTTVGPSGRARLPSAPVAVTGRCVRVRAGAHRPRGRRGGPGARRPSATSGPSTWTRCGPWSTWRSLACAPPPRWRGATGPTRSRSTRTSAHTLPSSWRGSTRSGVAFPSHGRSGRSAPGWLREPADRHSETCRAHRPAQPHPAPRWGFLSLIGRCSIGLPSPARCGVGVRGVIGRQRPPVGEML